MRTQSHPHRFAMEGIFSYTATSMTKVITKLPRFATALTVCCVMQSAPLFAQAAHEKTAASAPKISAYVRAGSSTGLFAHDVSENDACFSGANVVFNASATASDYVFACQAKVKLSSCDTYKEAYTSSSWEKAYLGINLPCYSALRLWGGHALPLYLQGSYLTQLDVVSSGARWLKDGIGLQYRSDLVSLGVGITSDTTTRQYLYKGFKAASGLQLNFARYDIPLQIGATLLFDNYDAAAEDFAVEARDWTSAAFAQYKPAKWATLTAGYCINGAPVTTNTTFLFVEYYSKSANSEQLQHSHVVTLNSTWKLPLVTIEEEAEGAKSFDENFYSLYSTLRLKIPVGSYVTWLPAVQYFAVCKRDNADCNRESLVLYPRVQFESGRHLFSLGAKIEHRELESDSYHWIIKIPASYKYTL